MRALINPIFEVTLASLRLHHGELLRSVKLICGLNFHKLDASARFYQLNRGMQDLIGDYFLTGLFFHPINLAKQFDVVITLIFILVIVNDVFVIHLAIDRSFREAHNLNAFLDKEAFLVCGTHAVELFREFLNNRANVTIVHTNKSNFE